MNITDYGPLKETKSHFDSDFLYNTYPCSIPLDFTEVPLHWHNEMELIYIKKGCMIVSVDLEYSVVNAGDIVVVMPGHIHSIIQNESDSCEYENILFNLDMLVSRQCDYETVSFFNGIAGFKGYCPPVISKTTPYYSDLIHYIDEADNICKYFPDGYRLKIRACLFNFFFELNSHFYTHTDMPVHLSDDKMAKLKLILNYIEKNFARAISIEEIAQWCHFSQSHFMKFFKNCTGTSFITYLNDYRLIIAARILKTTTQPVIIVASDCGFDNISYFNRKFKEKYGVSPREFRKIL